MSGMFKSKKITPDTTSGSQESRISALWNQLQGNLFSEDVINSKGYSGEKVAPLTSMETQNLSRLNDYLASPLSSQSDLYKQAESQLSSLLNQDPWAEGGAIDYTQKRLQKYLTQDLLPATRTRAASTGNLYSSGYVDDENTQVKNVMDEMTQYAYNYQNQLNSLKANLIPTAANMVDYSTNEPLKRISDTMGLAGYERTNYQQPLDTAEYQDYMSQLSQYLNAGLQLAGMNGQSLYYPSYQPSTFEKYVMPAMQMGAQAAGAMAIAGM